jgi:hypothetical protein
VDEQRFIELPSIHRRNAIGMRFFQVRSIFSISPKMLAPHLITRNIPLSKEMGDQLAEFPECLSRRSTQEYAKLTHASSGEATTLTFKNE